MFDVKQNTLANIDCRIKKWGNNENLQQWRKESESDELIYKGLDWAWAAALCPPDGHR